MNWDQVAGSWNEVQGKITAQWGKLTSDVLAETRGKRDEIVGLLQRSYGMAKEEAERKIDDFIRAL